MTFSTPSKSVSSSVVDVDELMAKLEVESATSVTETSSSDGGDDRANADDCRLTRVGFTSIQIRRFDRVAGDHPDVRKGGPPLAIGWDYVQDEPMDLDDYELAKASSDGSDKPEWMLLGMRRLTCARRLMILRSFDVSDKEIAQAIAEAQRVRKQREQTNWQPKAFGLAEEMVQSAKRKMKKMSDNKAASKQTMAKPMASVHKKQPTLRAVSA